MTALLSHQLACLFTDILEKRRRWEMFEILNKSPGWLVAFLNGGGKKPTPIIRQTKGETWHHPRGKGGWEKEGNRGASQNHFIYIFDPSE